MKFTILITFILTTVFILIFRPVSSIFNFGLDEIYFINEQRSYYPISQVGKIFENKVQTYISHYLQNLSYGLDINYYFFASHPRERPGHLESSLFPFWLLPLFAYGLYRQIMDRHYHASAYFISCLLLISFFSFDRYAFLLFPFILFNIAIGILCALKSLPSLLSR